MYTYSIVNKPGFNLTYLVVSRFLLFYCLICCWFSWKTDCEIAGNWGIPN